MASAPLLFLLVATASPPAQPAVMAGEHTAADVLSALIDAGDVDETPTLDLPAPATPKKKRSVPAPAFVVVEENRPAPSQVAFTPPLEPARPGSPRGPPRA